MMIYLSLKKLSIKKRKNKLKLSQLQIIRIEKYELLLITIKKTIYNNNIHTDKLKHENRKM